MLFWLCFKLPCGVYFIANYIRPHPFGKVRSVFYSFKELQIHPRSSILRVLLLKHTFSIDHSYLLAGNSYIAQLSNYLRMWTFCLFCHLQQSNLSGIMFRSLEDVTLQPVCELACLIRLEPTCNNSTNV